MIATTTRLEIIFFLYFSHFPLGVITSIPSVGVRFLYRMWSPLFAYIVFSLATSCCIFPFSHSILTASVSGEAKREKGISKKSSNLFILHDRKFNSKKHRVNHVFFHLYFRISLTKPQNAVYYLL